MINIKQKPVIILLLLVLVSQTTFAYAWGRPAHPRYRPHGVYIDTVPFAAATLLVAGMEYFYWQGEYYRREHDRYIVVTPPVGTVVTTIPAGYQPVIIDGVTYYVVNGVTYMYTSTGYQVVPQPRTIVVQNDIVQVQPQTTVQAPTSATSDTSFTVNIPNTKGGYTPVVLKRSGSGFVGPQGEYYSDFPRVEQLKVMYAK